MRAREFVINVPITIKISGDSDPEVVQNQEEPELDNMVPPLHKLRGKKLLRIADRLYAIHSNT